jgi:hypothetical protein
MLIEISTLLCGAAGIFIADLNSIYFQVYRRAASPESRPVDRLIPTIQALGK